MYNNESKHFYGCWHMTGCYPTMQNGRERWLIVRNAMIMIYWRRIAFILFGIAYKHRKFGYKSFHRLFAAILLVEPKGVDSLELNWCKATFGRQGSESKIHKYLLVVMKVEKWVSLFDSVSKKVHWIYVYLTEVFGETLEAWKKLDELKFPSPVKLEALIGWKAPTHPKIKINMTEHFK